MKGYRQSLGRWGEGVAASYLTGKGYKLLEKNARTPFGEIDLIAYLEAPAGCETAVPVVVFVEVKTRSSTTYGLPEASITPRKKAHLMSAIQAYMQAHPELRGDFRVDVVAIQTPHAGQPLEIVHFENAL